MAQKVWHLIPVIPKGQPFVMEKSPIILGRANSCDIVISDQSIAEFQIQFNFSGSDLFIYNLENETPVSIDGHPFKTEKKLIKTRLGKKGLLFQIGNIKSTLIYQEPLAELPASTPSTNQKQHDELFFSSQGKIFGPMVQDDLFQYAQKGQIQPLDDVWFSAHGKTIKALDIKGLFKQDLNIEQNRALSTQITCPYCWTIFEPENLLYISKHPDLMGDSVLGPEEYTRFLPRRLNPKGQSIDAKGLVCSDKACPYCHLRIPTTILRDPPIFISIVGAPGSGKSVYLASTTWRLRNILPDYFGCGFTDIDALANQWINEYEERLFFQPNETSGNVIPKTQISALPLYRQAQLNDMLVYLPIPCMFSLQSKPDAPYRKSLKHTLTLYDNAGEHFQPGRDTVMNPGIQHVSRSEGILFFFDPGADPRFQDLISGAIQSSPQRQDVLLTNVINTLREQIGLSPADKYKKPFFILISKSDLLGNLFDLSQDPWIFDPETGSSTVDLDQIQSQSHELRTLFLTRAPEIVHNIESFAQNILYLPITALGQHTDNSADQVTSPMNNAQRFEPRMVEVPILYILAQLGYLDKGPA